MKYFLQNWSGALDSKLAVVHSVLCKNIFCQIRESLQKKLDVFLDDSKGGGETQPTFLLHTLLVTTESVIWELNIMFLTD